MKCARWCKGREVETGFPGRLQTSPDGRWILQVSITIGELKVFRVAFEHTDTDRACNPAPVAGL